MTQPHRIVRPEPARTGPIRSGGFFGGAPATEPGGQAAAGAGRASGRDPLLGAVETGYRVIEDYIRQGESVARGLRGPPSGDPLGGNLQDLATRWFQYTSEMTELWLQLVGLAAAGESLRTAPPARPEPPPAPPRRMAEPEPVAVTVHCRRPVEVTLDLRPSQPGGRLRVHDLREVDPDRPRIGDLAFTRSPEGLLRFEVRVDDQQPPGTYSGVVLDEETSLPAGTVSVRILP